MRKRKYSSTGFWLISILMALGLIACDLETNNATFVSNDTVVELGDLCGKGLPVDGLRCPLPCWELKQAAHCQASHNCGWCSFNGSLVDGRGLCLEGDVSGPTGGVCRLDQVEIIGEPLPTDVAQWWSKSEGDPKWYFAEKPPENECRNDHHTCDENLEDCIDRPDGFICRCKSGYAMNGNRCETVCSQGCVNGLCISPDVCQCHFGFVGSNCSAECECNGHSNCVSEDRLSDCIECHNNTQGMQCQFCKPFYVGSPANGIKCTSCKVYCNGHSDICLSSNLIFNNSVAIVWDQIAYIDDLIDFVKEGPESDAICIKCKDNTFGERCEHCLLGYFKAGQSIYDGCRLCQCHGHGEICDQLSGESCNCNNNTENGRECTGNKHSTSSNSKSSTTPCWQLQCSKCKEYFLGVPTFGHQCYRHMYLDEDYCFDPNSQEECKLSPNGLGFGLTVFYAVQPRYMNVDIRIVIDVAEGQVDFYLAAKEDVFIVEMNKTSFFHCVWLDNRYSVLYEESHNDNMTLLKKRTQTSNELPYNIIPPMHHHHHGPPLKMKHTVTNQLANYITINDPYELLVVRNVQNRLIVTIPQEVHDLRTTRFYMILQGSGNQSFGNLFFRQDQSRIDLFVFFSVFFSCFFLFLAICVIVWKVKQAFDLRRARRLHAAEMKHMASRPFARLLMLMDSQNEPDDFEFALSSPVHIHQSKRSKSAFRLRGSHSSLRDSPKNQSLHVDPERYLIRPIAVEPTADGVAAVVTTVIILPGGLSVPVRMSLGSCLVSVRGSHHLLNSTNNNSSSNVSAVGGVLRAAMRRSHLPL